MILFIRSLFFNIFFICWTTIILVIFLPYALVSEPKKNAFIGRIWASGTLYALKLICNLKMQVKGRHHIPEMPFLVASKHQSDLETLMFHLLLNKPVFILKKELLKIPLFGTHLNRMGMISIDRDGKMSAIKKILLATKKTIEDHRPVIIFPEGTRTNPNHQTKLYHSGITAIYTNNNYRILPVALNTGKFWTKNSFIKKPGTFVIEFLPVIEPGLSKEEFNKILFDRIESASLKLL